MKTARPAGTLALCAVLASACVQTARATTPVRLSRAVSEAQQAHATPRRPLVPMPEAEAPTSSDPCSAQAWSATLDALLAPTRDTPPGAVAPRRPWDHVTAPRYIDRVERRFDLTPDERDMLARNGFVVPDRLEAATYAYAYHLVHEAELPVYVSADSVLHAVASLHSPFVEHLEAHTLAPMLQRALRRMHDALPLAAQSMPAESAADVDLLLTVARSLLELDNGTVPPALTHQRAIDDYVNAARAATRRSERYLFGRARVMDFTAFEARGRYARSRELTRYHRAATWLARIELNLLSRGCRSSHPGEVADTRETPREALAALSLVELAQRAGVSELLARIDQALSLVEGRREDVSPTQLAEMRDIVRIRDLRADDTFERLSSIARNRPRVALRTNTVPASVSDLPVTFSLLGARVRPGETMPASFVAPSIPGREVPTAAEAAYAIGIERARRWLNEPLGEHPELERHVGEARGAVRDTVGGNDLLSNWFRAIQGLGAPPEGRTPGFMATDAFADLRVNTAVASYGAYLRRDGAGAERAFTALGCRIPTGWVDAVPDTWGAIEMYAERALALARSAFAWELDRPATLRERDRAFLRSLDALSRVARALRVIAGEELAGRVPGPLETSLLAMIAEIDAGDSSGAPRFDGWYFHLFPSVDAAMERADFAAEWGASSAAPAHAWIGSATPRLGFFVIDNGGMPFVAVGPVARAWEVTAPAGARPERVLAKARTEGQSPWSASWLVAQGPEPPLALTLLDPDDAQRRTFVARSREDLGPVTLELLDGHGVSLGSATRVVDEQVTRFVFTRTPQRVERGDDQDDDGWRHDHHHHHGAPHHRHPRYIDNTRAPWAPRALRVRTQGFWYERPLRPGERVRLTLGNVAPIDERGMVDGAR